MNPVETYIIDTYIYIRLTLCTPGAGFLANPPKLFDIFIVVYSFPSWLKLLQTTLVRSQCFVYSSVKPKLGCQFGVVGVNLNNQPAEQDKQ